MRHPNRTPVGDAVVAILKEYPDFSSRTLGRLLHERHPHLFKDADTARILVLGYRGRNLRRCNLAYGEFFNQRVDPVYHELPKPLSPDKPWNVVEISFRRCLLFGDVHIPFHSINEVRLCLEYGRARKPDCIIINGDLIDFHAVSFWERDPNQRDLARELEQAKRFLEVLRHLFPKARVLYKEGNHEERLWRYVCRHCPELYNLRAEGKRVFSLATLVDAEAYGVEIVDNKRPIRCGEHLHVLHGHEFRAPFQNPVNPARGLYLRAKCNAICGDLHQTSNHTETGLERTVSCWSHGHLCDPHPPYMPLNKWNFGFAFLEMHKETWRVENLKIIKGKIV